jgi:hypothetical protein
MGSRKIALTILSALAVVCVLAVDPALAQQAHRNGFETRVPAWFRGSADSSYRELAHDISDKTSHTGQLSEHIQIDAEQGNAIQYMYALGKATICEELNISVWLKANRPGIQLQARVVLPRERGNNLDDRLTTILRGDQYQLSGRWQRLELRGTIKLSQQQQQFMRLELKRDVDFRDAYVDRLILSIQSGPGMTEMWIDDLEASPVSEAPPPAAPAPTGTGTPGTPTGRVPARPAVVELNQDRLLIGGKPFFFVGIKYSDTPLKTLHDAGFNTLCLDYNASPGLLEEAIKQGFWLVPSLPVTSNDPRFTSPGGIGQEISRFLMGDAVLFWDLGNGLVEEQKDVIARAVRAIRMTDTQRPLTADVWDGFRPYSRNLDLVAVHRWPLMTSLELPQYQNWLNQRRLLTRPGTFFWTWVQTHLPDWYANLIYEQTSAMPFKEPVGPQPEQIRLLSYIALSAGCHGLGYWSDRFLADSHQGRDRLLTLALLNQEMKMLEPLMLTADVPFWITSETHGDVKAAVFHTEQGLVVLPMWLGKGGQYVPGQSAASKVKLVVPEVPGGATAWKVSPAEVRCLAMERIPGGTRITIPEFGLTAAIVFTADTNQDGLLVRFQDHCRRMSKQAAQWAHDLAQVEFEKVNRIEQDLEQNGHTLPDAKTLIEDSQKRLRLCEQQWEIGNYPEAYAEAERSMRPLRILMRAQWEQAIRGLDVPTASPYAVSFYTLPRHWRFMQQLAQTTPGNNVLPDGDFETPPDQVPESWTPQEANADQMQLRARRVPVGTLPIQPNRPNPSVLKLKSTPLFNYAITTANQMSDPKPAPKPELGQQCLELSIRPPLPPGTLDPEIQVLPGVQPSSPPSPPSPPSPRTQPLPPPVARGQMPDPRDSRGSPGSNGPRPRAYQPQAQPSLPPQTQPTANQKGPPPPAALERTFLAINSPTVHLPPGSLVRISCWIFVPVGIAASADGALFYDSAGGEPLGIRVNSPMNWKKFTLYRRVPASGSIYVTMALTGLGKVYFDNVKIEPLLPMASASAAAPPQ